MWYPRHWRGCWLVVLPGTVEVCLPKGLRYCSIVFYDGEVIVPMTVRTAIHDSKVEELTMVPKPEEKAGIDELGAPTNPNQY